jgi:hypothetical protein
MGAERERIAGFGKLRDGPPHAGYWHRWGRSILVPSAGRG